MSAVLDQELTRQTVAALLELGRVNDLAQLGTRGPLLASAGHDSWFHCVFGRDALRMAHDLLEDFPKLARSTLLELARLQGVRHEPRADEEPGRILHEHRDSAGPRLNATPDRWLFPYYGAVDTTPAWITLLHAYCRRWDATFLTEEFIDRLGTKTTIAMALERATLWLTSRLDGPVPGYLAARRALPGGMINQAWMDSFDSLYFSDGTLFDPDRWRVVVEVQGAAFEALLAAADMLEGHTGKRPPEAESPETLRRRAAQLRSNTVQEFWLEHEGTFAIAALQMPGGELRVSSVVGSNPGHLLATGLLDGAEHQRSRERLIERLLRDDMLAGAGIRTKSTQSARFHPGAYHNGSSWPFDTGVFADGLRRYGFHREADDLESRIVDACTHAGGFPEFLRGETDGSLHMNRDITDVLEPDGRTTNRLEQPPQAMQGWTVTRVWRILRRRGLAAAPLQI